eukprot:Pgem_evm1s19039
MFSKISLFPVACLFGQTFAAVHFSTNPTSVGECTYEKDLEYCTQQYRGDCWEDGWLFSDKKVNVDKCTKACADKSITKLCKGHDGVIRREGVDYYKKCACPPGAIPALEPTKVTPTTSVPVPVQTTPAASAAPAATTNAPASSSSSAAATSVSAPVTTGTPSSTPTPSGNSASSVTFGVISLAFVLTNTI